MAGSLKIFNAACKQLGIISVDSLEEMVANRCRPAKVAAASRQKRGDPGRGRGGSVTMTDAAEREGLKVPQLSEANDTRPAGICAGPRHQRQKPSRYAGVRLR